MSGTFVANDCLGLAQYIVKTLPDAEALRYLLTVEALTIDDWRKAKDILKGTSSTNRSTIEGNIKEIISAFRNNQSEAKYLVENLSVLPGLSIACLQLQSYSNSVLEALKHNIERIVTTDKTLARFSSETDKETSPTSTTSEGDSPRTKTYSEKLQSGLIQQPRKQQQRQQYKWRFGTDTTSQHNTQAPPQSYLCLAIKSGPDETESTLKAEFGKWANQVKDLRVEAFSQSVKFIINCAYDHLKK